MYFRQEIGKWGESLACQYLSKNNYEIMKRNFRCCQGEIDIIARDVTKNEFVFVEVKTRSNLRYGNPSDAVTKLKQKYMRQTAKYYIYKNDLDFQKIRFDMIEVFIQKERAKVNHIEQVF